MPSLLKLLKHRRKNKKDESKQSSIKSSTKDSESKKKGKKQKEKYGKILILGLENAGKTTVLRQLTHDDVEGVTPTTGFNYKSVQSEGFRIDVWDIGGQKAIRGYWSEYFTGTSVLIFVVDSTDLDKLEEVASELQKLLSAEELKKVPIVIFANKQDLPTAMHKDELIGVLDLVSVKDRTWVVSECSARTGEGLESGMEHVFKFLG